MLSELQKILLRNKETEEEDFKKVISWKEHDKIILGMLGIEDISELKKEDATVLLKLNEMMEEIRKSLNS